MSKKLLIKLTIFFIFCINIISVFAATDKTNTDLKIINSFNSFISKIENTLSRDKQVLLLNQIKIIVNSKIQQGNLSEDSIYILNKIKELANTQLKIIITPTNEDDIDQVELEEKEIQKFKDLENEEVELPGYVSLLISDTRKYIKTIQTSNGTIEFLEDGTIKKIDFTDYTVITRINYLFLKQNSSGYIFSYNGNYILVKSYELESKIPYSKGSTFFKGYINNTSYNYHEKDGIYYTYRFDNFNYTDDNYGFYIDTLKKLSLDPSEILLFKDNGKYYFIKDFTEQKLISSNIISNITDKDLFLSLVYDDKKNITKETDDNFKNLKELSSSLTKGLSNDDKIKTLYIWIVKNISYTNPIDLTKKEIFSGIDTFINKNGVCEGYSKLMAYMLMFSGIEDLEVIRGYVIDAQDFPDVGHAWIKIGDYYYDPTFDDPILNTQEMTFSDYIYYKLPKDLFYVNRYNFGDLPENLKTKTLTEREEIVNQNLYSLVDKYKNSNYNLMRYPLFLYNSGLSYKDTITLTKLENIFTTYVVDGSDMSFIKNGQKVYIKSMKYYELTQDNIMIVLKTINYKTSGKVLLKIDNNGTYSYRLIYSMDFYSN